jgi:hypothetical protein
MSEKRQFFRNFFGENIFKIKTSVPDGCNPFQEESKGRPQSITDKIFAVIREMAQNAKTLKIADIKER